MDVKVDARQNTNYAEKETEDLLITVSSKPYISNDKTIFVWKLNHVTSVCMKAKH